MNQSFVYGKNIFKISFWTKKILTHTCTRFISCHQGLQLQHVRNMKAEPPTKQIYIYDRHAQYYSQQLRPTFSESFKSTGQPCKQLLCSFV